MATFAVPDTADFLATIWGSPFATAPAAIVEDALEAAARHVNFDLAADQGIAFDVVYLQAAMILIDHPKAVKMRQALEGRREIWARELDSKLDALTFGVRTF